jgi:hypothetical protein
MVLERKKIAIFAGLFGWALIAFFSLWNIGKVFSFSCYYLSDWPFCGPADTIWSIIWQMLILLVSFAALAFFGYYAFKKWDTSENVKVGLLIAGVLIFLALLTLPFASNDTQFYYSLGKTVSQNVDPYTQTWNIENKFFYPPAVSQTLGVMYGPVALDFFNLFYSISGNNVLFFILLWKIFMVAILLVCGQLVFRMMGPARDKKIFYVFWLSQPLILFEWIANGHFDGLWLMFLLLAFILADRKKWWAVILCLTVGAWIKFIPLLLAPLFLLWWWQDLDKDNWRKKIPEALGGLLGAGLFTVLAWWPYWQGMKVFEAIALQSKWAVHSLFAASYYSLQPLSLLFFHGRAHWFLTRFLHIALALAVLYFIYPLLKQVWFIILRKTKWRPEQFLSASFIGLLIYLIVWQKSLWPWYPAFIMPLGLIAYARAGNIYLKKILLWLGLAPLFFYAPWMMFGGDTTITVFYWYSFALLSVFPLIQLWRWRRADYRL